MDKKTILRRLHHRAPYLLIDEVIDHNSKMIHARVISSENHFYLSGHFPGAPVIPGAMMQEMTTQAAGVLIAEHFSPVPDYDSDQVKGWALGVLRAVHHAKYKKFARPGEKLDIKIRLIDHFENSFRFKGQIEIGNERVMNNEFTLINISEEKLRGTGRQEP